MGGVTLSQMTLSTMLPSAAVHNTFVAALLQVWQCGGSRCRPLLHLCLGGGSCVPEAQGRALSAAEPSGHALVRHNCAMWTQHEIQGRWKLILVHRVLTGSEMKGRIIGAKRAFG
jgi:hypothetical protein